MTVEQIVADAANYFAGWHEVLYVFFFLLVTGLIACFVSFRVLQWISKLTLGHDDEACDDDRYHCLGQFEDEDDDEESD